MTPDDDTAPLDMSQQSGPRKDWIKPRIELLHNAEIESGTVAFVESYLVTGYSAS